jgi:hypothetical protein
MRQCRKEAKELLVEPKAKDDERLELTPIQKEFVRVVSAMDVEEEASDEEAEAKKKAEEKSTKARAARTADIRELDVRRGGVGTAYIGGGCCVHLSIEYTSINEKSIVAVKVHDSDGTMLAWGKRGSKPGYYIKECIISTNPGAKLEVTVLNAIARVRWCEIFSC